MKTVTLILSLLTVARGTVVRASEDLYPLFETHFEHRYQAGRCGQNILDFLTAAKREGYDIRQLYMLAIENKGISGFGMVNVEQARDYLRNEWVATERNWYHHVIALDSSGRVYDFDFLTTPSVTSLKDYAERMFLKEDECNGEGIPGQICVGRREKLKDYNFKIIPAHEALAGTEPEGHYKSISFEELLRDWKTLLRPRS